MEGKLKASYLQEINAGDWTTFPSSFDLGFLGFNFARFSKLIQGSCNSEYAERGMLKCWLLGLTPRHLNSVHLGLGLGNLYFVKLQADLFYVIHLIKAYEY